jgi:hypothetical protein
MNLGVVNVFTVPLLSVYRPGPTHRPLKKSNAKTCADKTATGINDQKFVENLGPEGLKKLALLEASCLESKQTDLFFIDPKMSYPTEGMQKADPEFWKPSRTATR